MLSRKDRLLTACICIFCLGLNVCGCGKKAGQERDVVNEDKIIARVGDDMVTVDEYIEELALLPPTHQEIAHQHRNEFLDSLIERHLLLQEAQRRDLQNHENVKKYLKKAKEELMIQQLVEDEVSRKIEVTDSEIAAHYRDHGSEYTQPPRFRASHIVVEEEGQAKKLLSDIQDGADFSELALEHSYDTPTKHKGGDLGYFSKDEFFPEIVAACELLDIGALSIVKTRMGYHIIKVIDKKEAKARQLEDVKDYIRQKLALDKQIDLYEQLIAQLQKKSTVTVDQDRLDKITPPSSP